MKVYNLLILLIIIFSCNKSKYKKEQQKIDKNLTSYSKEKSIDTLKIIQLIYNKTPQYYKLIEKNNEMCILGVFSNQNEIWGDSQIFILKKFANNWQEFTFYNVENGNNANNFDITTVNNKKYLYFDYLIPGGSVGNANIIFCLFDLESENLIKLEFEGFIAKDGESVAGQFININELKKYPKELIFLEDKASVSKLIYRPTKKDLDMENPENASSKFHIDNPYLHDNLITHVNNWYEIKTFEYKNLDYFNKIIKNKTTSITIEVNNEKYDVYSFFKSYILVFNKISKKYFVIWIPITTYDWVNYMTISKNNILILYNRFTNQKEFEIDIENSKIRSLIKLEL